MRKAELSIVSATPAVSGRRPQTLGGGCPTASQASGVGGDALRRAVAGVQDGGVVAAAEARGRSPGASALGELAREVHGDLARPGDGGRAAGARGARRARRRTPAPVTSWISRRGRAASAARASRVEAGEDLGAPASAIGGSPGERGVGDDADERALERADVVGRRGRRSRSRTPSSAIVDAVVLGALAQDREARGEVGRLESATRPASKRSRRRSSRRGEVARERGRR